MSKLRPLLLASGVLFAIAAVHACASAPRRWVAYPGCSAGQCQTWFEECRAECLNAKGAVQECQDRCQAPVGECQSACGS